MSSQLPTSMEKWTEYYRQLGGRANPRWNETELKHAVRELEKQLYESYQTWEDATIQTQTSGSNQRAEIQAWNTGIQFLLSRERTDRGVATGAAGSSAVDHRLSPWERYAASRVNTRTAEDDLAEYGATPDQIYRSALAEARERMEHLYPPLNRALAERACEEMAIAAVRDEAAERLATATAENRNVQVRWGDQAAWLVAAHLAPRPVSPARQGPAPRPSSPVRQGPPADSRWCESWWLQLEGDWADDRGNEYKLTLELDTSLAYTVCTRRRNGEVRITESLIYNLHGLVLWGNDGQFILREHGARGTRAGTILTHIGWASVCKCGSVAKESKFVWTRKGEGSPPPPPTEPPPSYHMCDTRSAG